MIDLKPWIPIALAALSAAAGTGAGVGWHSTAVELQVSQETAARRLAKYHAAKELGRACMGKPAFDAEWSEVLVDIKEAEGTPNE